MSWIKWKLKRKHSFDGVVRKVIGLEDFDYVSIGFKQRYIMLKGDHFVKHCNLEVTSLWNVWSIDLCSHRIVRLRMKLYS